MRKVGITDLLAPSAFPIGRFFHAQAIAGILEPLYPVTFAQWRALRGTA